MMNVTTEVMSTDASTESNASLLELATWIPSNIIVASTTIPSPQAGGWIAKLSYYTLFLFITIGVVCNVLSFPVFARRVREKSGAANMYLAALAVCDALHIFCFSLIGIMMDLPSPVHVQWFTGCNIMSVVLYPVGQLSTLLVMTLTIDRCVAIRHPFLYRRIQSRKQAGGTIAGMAVFVSAIGWHFFGGLEPVTEEELSNGSWDFCRGKQDLIDIYNLVWYPLTDAIVFWAAPSMVMFICNIAIIKTIRVKIKQKKSPGRTTEAEPAAAGIEEQVQRREGVDISGQTNLAFRKHRKPLTRVSFVLSISFFILVAPLIVFALIQFIIEMSGMAPLPLPGEVQYALQHIFAILYLTNYSCNFWLYCFCTPSFRRDLKEVMCGKICGCQDELNKNGSGDNII